MAEEQQVLNFGDFFVDLGDRRLNGPVGPIHLGGRAFDILVVLLEADGRLVTKDELFERVWQGISVSDAALTSAIRELRLALGDDGKDGMIKAVYGKGYRMEVPPTRHSSRVPSKPEPTKKSATAAPKVAVLPFDDLSPGSDVAYFSDGVSEEILSKLSRGSGLRTMGKLSSFAYRGADKARAASELGASHILDGSVRRSGDRVRITAHLFDASSRETLWSDSFDGALADLLATQISVAEAIADRLQHSFIQPSQTQVDPAVYDFYLRAKGMEFADEHIEVALALLERVTREAPDFAPGWGLLASILGHRLIMSPLAEWPELAAQAQAAIAAARSLDPAEPTALSAEMRLTRPYSDYDRQFALLKSMAPVMDGTSSYHFFTAWVLSLIGRFEEAIGEAALARELDPAGNTNSAYYGICLYYAGRLEDAREVLLEDLRLLPDNRYLAATLLICAALLNDRSLVEELLDPSRLQRYPLGHLEQQAEIARIELDGDRALTRKFATAVRQRCIATNRFDAMSAVYLARYSSPVSCHDLISKLPIGPVGEAATDFVSLSSMFLLLRNWNEVRRDARFPNLCARFGLAQHWTKHDTWPDCANEDDLGYAFRHGVERAAEQMLSRGS